ncbi:MAG: selenium-dependent molybdenum hydroxylase 1 [Elusimicrobia bacterium]|nr:MAG: selenium-dependent molybdenum hydroxylase 1 [Elusimicrobiota bacterium]
MIRFKLDGAPREYAGDPGGSLLRWLRDEAGVTGVKDGCSPQAACGCCTVEVGGKAVLSCVTSMSQVAGKDVATLESIPAPA